MKTKAKKRAVQARKTKKSSSALLGWLTRAQRALEKALRSARGPKGSPSRKRVTEARQKVKAAKQKVKRPKAAKRKKASPRAKVQKRARSTTPRRSARKMSPEAIAQATRDTDRELRDYLESFKAQNEYDAQVAFLIEIRDYLALARLTGMSTRQAYSTIVGSPVVGGGVPMKMVLH